MKIPLRKGVGKRQTYRERQRQKEMSIDRDRDSY